MDARARLNQLKEKFGSQILRADVPNDSRLYVDVDPEALKAICRYVFRDLDARYVISVGADDRPYSGNFMVYHDFAFDKDKILFSIIVQLPADNPKVDSISDIVPGANWAEREIRDMFGIEPGRMLRLAVGGQSSEDGRR